MFLTTKVRLALAVGAGAVVAEAGVPPAAPLSVGPPDDDDANNARARAEATKYKFIKWKASRQAFVVIRREGGGVKEYGQRRQLSQAVELACQVFDLTEADLRANPARDHTVAADIAAPGDATGAAGATGATLATGAAGLDPGGGKAPRTPIRRSPAARAAEPHPAEAAASDLEADAAEAAAHAAATPADADAARDAASEATAAAQDVGLQGPLPDTPRARFSGARSPLAPPRTWAHSEFDDVDGADAVHVAHAAVDMNQQVRQLRLWLEVYDGGALPGDLMDMVHRRRRRHQFYLANPAVTLLACSLKYGPARDEFERALQGTDLAALTTTRLNRALVAVAKSLDGQDLGLWATSCGRNVSHHSGPVPVLMRFGVLKKRAPRAAGSGSSLVQIGVSGNTYEVTAAAPQESRKAVLDPLLGSAMLLRQFQSRPCGPWCVSSLESRVLFVVDCCILLTSLLDLLCDLIL